jgi:hypothetical protein
MASGTANVTATEIPMGPVSGSITEKRNVLFLQAPMAFDKASISVKKQSGPEVGGAGLPFDSFLITRQSPYDEHWRISMLESL